MLQLRSLARLRRYVPAVVCCTLLSACAVTSPEARRMAASAVATDAGWQRIDLDAGPFVLAAFAPPALKQTDSLTVYIEGDGMAWIASSMPSFDPTPREPLALRLSLLDPSGRAVYLARPCQYVSGAARRGCENKYWTSHRFAPEVITSSDDAVSQLKKRYGASKLRLVGYSGGGAVAALLAARRDDVDLLVTVAGNLDHAAWTTRYQLSPLSGSLNPADAWLKLQAIPQRHYVGGRDTVLGDGVAHAYAGRFAPDKVSFISVMPEFDHHCCWGRIWQDVVKGDFGNMKNIEHKPSRSDISHD